MRSADIVEVAADRLPAGEHYQVLASGNLADFVLREARASAEIDHGHVPCRHTPDRTPDPYCEPGTAHVDELSGNAFTRAKHDRGRLLSQCWGSRPDGERHE